MKLDLSSLKKFNPLSLQRSGASRQLINPAREWGVGLFIVVGVALSLFGYAGLDFYRQYNDSNMPVVSEESVPRYREQDAEFLIRYYEGREVMFEKLRSDKPYIPPTAPSPESAVPEDGESGGVAVEEIGG